MITLISAMGIHQEIGVNNALLWDLPNDMKHFRNRTKNKTVVMGRKTFESIGHALPYRKNIILTQSKEYKNILHEKNIDTTNINIIHSIPEVLAMHEKNPLEEIMIIGGSTIYEKFLPYATHLSLTFVQSTFPNADSFFPSIDFSQYKKTSCKAVLHDEKNIFNIEICEFEKNI